MDSQDNDSLSELESDSDELLELEELDDELLELLELLLLDEFEFDKESETDELLLLLELLDLPCFFCCCGFCWITLRRERFNFPFGCSLFLCSLLSDDEDDELESEELDELLLELDELLLELELLELLLLLDDDV